MPERPADEELALTERHLANIHYSVDACAHKCPKCQTLFKRGFMPGYRQTCKKCEGEVWKAGNYLFYLPPELPSTSRLAKLSRKMRGTDINNK